MMYGTLIFLIIIGVVVYLMMNKGGGCCGGHDHHKNQDKHEGHGRPGSDNGSSSDSCCNV